MVLVLVVDKDVAFCKRVKASLGSSFDVHFAHNCKEVVAVCSLIDIDIVLTSMDFPPQHMAKMLGYLRDDRPETRVIGLSEALKQDFLVQAIVRMASLGVSRVVNSPCTPADIQDAVDKEMENCLQFV